MTTSPTRVALVTVSLALTGFVCGALVGAAILLGTVLAYGALPRPHSVPRVLILGLLVGGPLGALAAPPVAWLFLRRVALGRAVGVTALGTILGGVAAARLAGLWTSEAAMFVAVPGALLGFLGAAVWLRRQSPAPAPAAAR